MAVLTWTLFCLKVTCIIAQDPQLMPVGLRHFCEGENQTFTCTYPGGSLWFLTGFDSLSDQVGSTAISIAKGSSRITTSDEMVTDNSSTLTVTNFVKGDNEASVACGGFSDRSETANVVVGPPVCNITLAIKEAAADSFPICWNATECNTDPTEFMISWKNLEINDVKSMTAQAKNFTIRNLSRCANYEVIVSVLNRCGSGSSAIHTTNISFGIVTVTAVETCSLYPIRLQVEVSGHPNGCLPSELLFSIGGMKVNRTYIDNPDYVYEVFNGTTGDMFEVTIGSKYTDTVTITSPPISVTIEQAISVFTEEAANSITFTCTINCRSLPDDASCSVSLTKEGYLKDMSKDFQDGKISITFENLSSATQYSYTASIYIGGKKVDETVLKMVFTLREITIPSTSPFLTNVAKIATAVTVSVVLSVISTAVITIILMYFCCIKKKNTKRSTQDINADYEVVEKTKTNKQYEDVQLQQSPAYGVLNSEN